MSPTSFRPLPENESPLEAGYKRDRKALGKKSVWKRKKKTLLFLKNLYITTTNKRWILPSE
jgi:hypothetical protein